MEEKLEKLKEIRKKLWEEGHELFEKIMRLEDFLNSRRITEVSKTQARLLCIQFQAMRTYHETIRARIHELDDDIFDLKEKM